MPAIGWAQAVLYCAAIEWYGSLSDDWGGDEGTPGGSGFEVLACRDPGQKERKLASELTNCRPAVMAFIGVLFQDGLAGSAYGDWTLYTDSPLRAFEDEMGAQPPLGYWDPLGFTSDGSAEDTKR